MKVRFDSNVDGGLAWQVVPAKAVTDDIGAVETSHLIAPPTGATGR